MAILAVLIRAAEWLTDKWNASVYQDTKEIHRVLPAHFPVLPAILPHAAPILVVPCWRMASQSVPVYRATSKVRTLFEDAYRKPINAKLIRVVLERDATAREYHLVTVRISWLEIHTKVAEVIITSDSIISIKNIFYQI